jgi:hypothetical protein
MLALTFLVSSAKVVPMLELLRESPRPTKDQGRLESSLVPKILLHRDQNSLYENRADIPRILKMDWDRENWHEFGAYIGIIPLILACAGLYLHHERQRPLAWAGMVCLWISMGRSAGMSLWAALHLAPIYRSLQVPSRFLMCVLFCIAIFAGLGCTELEKAAKKGYQRWLLAGAILFVSLDLLSVDGPIVANAFTIPPIDVSRSAGFEQGPPGYDAFLKAGSSSAMYPALLANRGTIDSYDIVAIARGAVKDARDADYRGEAFLAGSANRARVAHFSPNEITVAVDPDRKDVLVLNQNFHRGWQVESGGAGAPAISHDGLIAAPVQKGDKMVTFRYRPRSFSLGLLLTAVGLLALLPLLFPGLGERLRPSR